MVFVQDYFYADFRAWYRQNLPLLAVYPRLNCRRPFCLLPTLKEFQIPFLGKNISFQIYQTLKPYFFPFRHKYSTTNIGVWLFIYCPTFINFDQQKSEGSYTATAQLRRNPRRNLFYLHCFSSMGIFIMGISQCCPSSHRSTNQNAVFISDMGLGNARQQKCRSMFTKL